jgi:hypothetical protein
MVEHTSPAAAHLTSGSPMSHTRPFSKYNARSQQMREFTADVITRSLDFTALNALMIKKLVVVKSGERVAHIRW